MYDVHLGLLLLVSDLMKCRKDKTSKNIMTTVHSGYNHFQYHVIVR